MRDPESTRRRLLEAATAEFAAYGLAGARVDRIAETAGCNKQSIYGHFGSKEALFDAVYDEMVAQTMSNVPIDVFDLPDYASRLFDWYTRHPEVLRLATWQQLERGPASEVSESTGRVTRNKVDEIREAQAAGAVTRAIPAEWLLPLIVHLSTSQLEVNADPKRGESLKQALAEAIRRLVAP